MAYIKTLKVVTDVSVPRYRLRIYFITHFISVIPRLPERFTVEDAPKRNRHGQTIFQHHGDPRLERGFLEEHVVPFSARHAKI